jgi:hypothetical protein
MDGSGFNPKTYHDQIRLTMQEDIAKYAREIRFINGVKIGNDSLRFSSIEKNKLLDEVVASYNNPAKLIKFILNRLYVSRSSRLSPD